MTPEHLAKMQEGRKKWQEAKKNGTLPVKSQKAPAPAPYTPKSMRKQLKELLSMPVINSSAKKRLAKLGITDEDQSNQILLMVILFQKGLQGDLDAIKLMDDMTNGGLTSNGNNIQINLQTIVSGQTEQPVVNVTPAVEQVEVLDQ